ncbi:MAG: class I SAM-dependent methyltransferase [Vicinamibacteria bacterium]
MGARLALWRAAAGLVGQAARLERALALLAAALLRRDELRRRLADGWEGCGGGDDDSGLRPFEAELYARHLLAGERVLLLGCGSGRDLLALAARGHEVVGLDYSPPALERCRARLDAAGVRASLVAGAIEDVAPAGSFGAVVFSWMTASFVPEREQRVRALRRLAACLAPGGRIIASYLRRPPGTRRRGPALARALAALVPGGWRPETGDEIYLSRIARCAQVHYQHLFTDAELRAEAEAAGLRVSQQGDVDDGQDGYAVLEPRPAERNASSAAAIADASGRTPKS